MTHTDHGTALLAAIIAAPEEDTPRLVYADWCEENGQEDRAEFIRTQVELSRVDMGIWQNADPKSDMCWSCWIKAKGSEHGHKDSVRRFGCQCSGRVTSLRSRERELLSRLVETPDDPNWKYNFAKFAWRGGCLKGIEPTFRRGFVHAVTCDTATWLKHADKLVWSPTVECGTCAKRDARKTEEMRRYGGFLCGECRTHHPPGRVPNPNPPTTHQPIREVHLTTDPAVVLCMWNGITSCFAISETIDGPIPEEEYWISAPAYSDIDNPTVTITACLKQRWPGITFKLPSIA